MVQIIQSVFLFFFPFRSRPLIGGAGIAGKSASACFGTKRESRENGGRVRMGVWQWVENRDAARYAKQTISA